MTAVRAAPYPTFDGTQACADPRIDPDLFFPGAGRSGDAVQQAIDVCDGCTFRRPCLAYALTHHVYGIWGGTTLPTRTEIRQRHGIRAISMESTDSPDDEDLGRTAS